MPHNFWTNIGNSSNSGYSTKSFWKLAFVQTMLFLFFSCKAIKTKINRMSNSWRQGLFGCFDDRDTCEYFTLYCIHNISNGEKLAFWFLGQDFLCPRTEGQWVGDVPSRFVQGRSRTVPSYWNPYYLPCLTIFTYNLGSFVGTPS